MTSYSVYEAKYSKSWALVIGINDYHHVPPLGYACQDAQAIASLLGSTLGFPDGGVALLLDKDASRSGIMSSFLRFTGEDVSSDDRVVVFFAGHGCTRTGRRGEIGYLIPQDGDPSDLSTLVRWDDLTRNAELIRAKHVLFIMDACYGGLAVTRSLPPGSARFLKDMLQRYARQVLTAGKADEVVADAGGPRPGHSIFKGHLLDALEGGAASSDGVISANAVMAYVYDRVARDPHSRQSPHYGFLDGDGDLILKAPTLGALSADVQIDRDVLIQVPAVASAPESEAAEQPFADLVKDYLSEPRFRIRLDDLVTREIRSALHETREEMFPVQNRTITPADFLERLRRYERAMTRLTAMTILIARWAGPENQPMLERITARMADTNEQGSGLVVWLGLRWYPLTLLMYAGGIAALSAKNYPSLATLLTARLGARISGSEVHEAVVAAVDGMLEVKRTNIFKQLPGHERNYAPESEYLFKALQPGLEDLLFLGNGYEDLFDRYEMIQALVYADLVNRGSGGVWGPPGRFGWKHRGRLSRSPFDALVAEAEREGPGWPLLEAGLFAGSIDRFKEVAAAYREQLLEKLPWF